MSYRSGTDSLARRVQDAFVGQNYDFVILPGAAKEPKFDYLFRNECVKDVTQMSDNELEFMCFALRAMDSRVLGVSNSQSKILIRLGFHEFGQGLSASGAMSKMRDAVMKRSKAWVGAEVESVYTAARLGVSPALLNLKGAIKGPTISNVMDQIRGIKSDEIAMSIMRREGLISSAINSTPSESILTSGFRGQKISNNLNRRGPSDLIVRIPPITASTHDGQRKLRSVELFMMKRCNKVILVGGSPGTGYASGIPWRKPEDVVVIDPRPIEFSAVHFQEVVNTSSRLREIISSVAGPSDTIGVHFDIRSDPEPAIPITVRRIMLSGIDGQTVEMMGNELSSLGWSGTMNSRTGKLVIVGSGAGKTTAVKSREGYAMGLIDGDQLNMFPPGRWWDNEDEAKKVEQRWALGIAKKVLSGSVVLAAINPRSLPDNLVQLSVFVKVGRETLSRNAKARSLEDTVQPSDEDELIKGQEVLESEVRKKGIPVFATEKFDADVLRYILGKDSEKRRTRSVTDFDASYLGSDCMLIMPLSSVARLNKNFKHMIEAARERGSVIRGVMKLADLFDGTWERRAWEEAVWRDHILMNHLVKDLHSWRDMNIMTMQKARLYGSANVIEFSVEGWLLVQPYMGPASTEMRFVCAPGFKFSADLGRPSKTITRRIWQDLATELRDWRCQYGEAIDYVVDGYWANLAVEQSSKGDSYGIGAVGWLSLSNSLNDRDVMLRDIADGTSITVPYRSIWESNVVTEVYGNRKYTDNAISLIDELNCPRTCVPLSMFAGRLKLSNYLSRVTLQTVLFNPDIEIKEQRHGETSTQVVKFMSNAIRREWGFRVDDELYSERGRVIRTELSSIVNKVESMLSLSINVRLGDDEMTDRGEYFINGTVSSVSGHLIYILLGSMMGIPYGIKRYLSEKAWNAKTGDLGYEIGKTRGGKRMKHRRVWHYLVDDLLAVRCIRGISGLLGLELDCEIASKLMRGLETLELDLIKIAEEFQPYLGPSDLIIDWVRVENVSDISVLKNVWDTRKMDLDSIVEEILLRPSSRFAFANVLYVDNLVDFSKLRDSLLDRNYPVTDSTYIAKNVGNRLVVERTSEIESADQIVLVFNHLANDPYNDWFEIGTNSMDLGHALGGHD